jgi:hypothetical protein
MKALVIIGIIFCRLDFLGYVAWKEDDKMRKKGLEDPQGKGRAARSRRNSGKIKI